MTKPTDDLNFDKEKRKNDLLTRPKSIFGGISVAIMMFLVFPAGLILYAINWNRLNSDKNYKISLGLALLGYPLIFVIAFALNIIIFGYDSFGYASFILSIFYVIMLIIVLVVLQMWQQSHFREWIARYGKPSLREAGLGTYVITFVIGLIIIAVWTNLLPPVYTTIEATWLNSQMEVHTFDNISIRYPNQWTDSSSFSCPLGVECLVNIQSPDRYTFFTLFRQNNTPTTSLEDVSENFWNTLRLAPNIRNDVISNLTINTYSAIRRDFIQGIYPNIIQGSATFVQTDEHIIGFTVFTGGYSEVAEYIINSLEISQEK